MQWNAQGKPISYYPPGVSQANGYPNQANNGYPSQANGYVSQANNNSWTNSNAKQPPVPFRPFGSGITPAGIY